MGLNGNINMNNIVKKIDVSNKIKNLMTSVTCIFPGKFKPPHKGHFHVVKEACKIADEVIVLISQKDKEEFGPEISKNVWEQYKKFLPENVTIKISKYPSPVTEIYDIIKDKSNDYLVVYGKNERSRYESIIKNREKYFNVEVVDSGNVNNISATDLREDIRQNNLNEIKTFLPKGVRVKKFMENFKPLLESMNFPSPEFISVLDKWLFDSTPNFSSKLMKFNIPSIFKSGGTLYRGMKLSDEDIKNGFTLNNPTSWSKNKSIAQGFVNDPQYSISDKKQGTNVLISKNIDSNSVILDIYKFILTSDPSELMEKGLDELNLDSAYKEQEVLVKPGIKIEPKDITVLENLSEKNKYHDRLVAMAKRKDPDKLTDLGKTYLNENIEINKEKYLEYLNLCLEECCNELQIPIPQLEIINNSTYTDDNQSYGGYSPSENKIYLVIYGRNLKDSCVTLSHELKHHAQNVNNELEIGSGEDGDKWENEANSFAGYFLRKFGKKYPEIYFLKYS